MNVKGFRQLGEATLRIWQGATNRLPITAGAAPETFLDVLAVASLLRERGDLEPSSLALPDGFLARSSVRWNSTGRPVFTLTRDALASFLLTDVGTHTWEDLILPFQDFLILTPSPDSPLMFLDDTGAEHDVLSINVSVVPMATVRNPRYNTLLRTYQDALATKAPAQVLQQIEARFEVRPHLYVEAHGRDQHAITRTFRIPEDRSTPLRNWILGITENESRWLDDKSQHTMALVCRVLACLCDYLDGSGTQMGKPRFDRTATRRNVTGHRATEFEVGRDIHLPRSVRDAARALALSRKDAEARAAWQLLDQQLVRGHRKMQACGPKLQDRRKVHILPYWRGPEDGPTVNKTFILGPDSGPRE